MKSLLWREFHWNRLILVMGAAILVFPYVTVLIVGLWPHDDGNRLDRYHFSMAAIFSYGLSQLMVVFLGGNSFAGERADRSAEFLAYLPISRTQRFYSKLCLAAIVISVIWGANLLIFRIADGAFPWEAKASDDYFEFIRYAAITGLAMFGVGWFISAIQSSPTFAVCGGIAAPFLTMIGLILLERTLLTTGLNIANEAEFFATWYTIICVTLGLVAFVFGTGYFLKRIEP